MKAHCFVADSVEDIESDILKALNSGLSPTLGIIFASPKLGIEHLSEALGKYDIAFLGASTDGEIYASGNGKIVHEGTAVVSLVTCDRESFKVRLFDADARNSFDVGKDVGVWGASQFAKPSFILVSSGLHADGEEIVKGIQSITGQDTAIFGGLAGDDKEFKTTFVFTNGKSSSNGVVAFVLDGDRIELGGIATSGWIGIGAEKRITKASGNVVYTIDNESALEVYKKYLNITDNDLPQIGVDYPLMLMREDGSSVLRAVMDVDRNSGALIFAGTVPENSYVRFSSSSGFDVIEHVKKDIETYSSQFPEADHLILFSCMARHLALGPMVDEEISSAHEKWNAPLIGFFTYGEIGTNITGRCDFFNETFTLAVLKEKSK
jgi:hypothetical protein